MKHTSLRADLLGYTSKTEIKILEALSKNPAGLSVQEIAALIKGSPKYLYFALGYLICNGWVRVEKCHNGKNAGRPKNIYKLSKSFDEILKELDDHRSSLIKKVDLTNCKHPFHLVKIKRVAKIAKYRDLIQVFVDEERIGDVIETAVSKGLKVKECKKNHHVYEIIFRKT